MTGATSAGGTQDDGESAGWFVQPGVWRLRQSSLRVGIVKFVFETRDCIQGLLRGRGLAQFA